MTIGFLSLGCPKNQVNCEHMLWQAHQAGHEISLQVEDCDIAVINTCGFLQEACQEATKEIETCVALKAEGRIGKILVTGCMPQRYQAELSSRFPQVDGFLGTTGYENLGAILDEVAQGNCPHHFPSIDAPIPEIDRVVATSDHWAYLRIAEGCDNRCSYCMIPSIRGKFRSRSKEAILAEAKELASCGMKEILIIAQDITRYGLDLYGKRELANLLREMCQIEEISWIRLHYLYPDEIDDELISVIAEEDKILKYLDLPIQHISNTVLKAMNRRSTGEEIRALLTKLRKEIPALVLRTSLICGFPGETDEDFEALCVFLREYKIERAGIFAYSPEEGSPAARMENQVDEDVKRRRLELLTDIQLEVVDAYCEAQLGKTLTILGEGYDPRTDRFVGRSYAESPDIDGCIYVETQAEMQVGTFYEVKVIEAIDGELIALYEEA